MYYVYILKLSNHHLYTGSTEDIPNRLERHHGGYVQSTSAFRPIKLIHSESYALKSDAQRRERFLKTTEGKRLLKQQIRDILIKEQVIQMPA